MCVWPSLHCLGNMREQAFGVLAASSFIPMVLVFFLNVPEDTSDPVVVVTVADGTDAPSRMAAFSIFARPVRIASRRLPVLSWSIDQ